MKTHRSYLWLILLSSMILFCSSCSGDGPNTNPSPDPEPDPGPTIDKNVLTQAFSPGTGGYACFRIPAVVVSNKGTVLAFAEGRVDDCEDDGNIDIILKRSTDNGKTWSDIITVHDDGNNRCQNPAPVVLESGRILLLSCWNKRPGGARRVYKTYSDDDGKTWAPMTDIGDQVAIEGYSWYATGPCHAIIKTLEPNKGRVVVPCNHNKGNNRYSHVIYSDDQGGNWKLGGIGDYTQGNESTVVELGNGDLMLNMRNMDMEKNYRMQAISKDGGKTFQPSQETTLIEPINNGCQGSILRYSINSQNSANLLFANPNHDSSRRNGTIKFSSNDGKSWTRTFMYVPANTYTSYSDLTVLNNQKVGILYERGFKNGDGIYFQSMELKEITDSK